MMRQPLELQRQRTDLQRLRRGRFARQRLHRQAVRGGVPRTTIPRQGFHIMQGAGMRRAEQQFFDPAVRIAQGGFQMQNFFTVALEAVMHRRRAVPHDRPQADFMDFGTVNSEK